jgi:hypothetical protein
VKAIVQNRFGPPEVLRLADVDRPTVGAGDVLVRVHAAGVDPGVWHLMTGKPYLIRLMGFGLRAPKIPLARRRPRHRLRQPGDRRRRDAVHRLMTTHARGKIVITVP